MGKHHKFDRLPEPLNQDRFHLLKKGIYGRGDIDVWINEKFDYICLDPIPNMEYKNYQSRAKKLGLVRYMNQDVYYMKRLSKIKNHITNCHSILEIGASNGKFLECVNKEFPSKKMYAIEPDVETLHEREQRDIRSYSCLKDFLSLNKKVDVVCMFHVFEHILDPVGMLRDVAKILEQNGILVIEIPVLTDPLLKLYELQEFSDFYFQPQHPYVYSASSLEKVLLNNGYKICATKPFQRYGLENHLSWLKNRRPGGDPGLAEVVDGLDKLYCENLENIGITDSVIVIAGL